MLDLRANTRREATTELLMDLAIEYSRQRRATRYGKLCNKRAKKLFVDQDFHLPGATGPARTILYWDVIRPYNATNTRCFLWRSWASTCFSFAMIGLFNGS